MGGTGRKGSMKEKKGDVGGMGRGEEKKGDVRRDEGKRRRKG